MKVLNPTVSVEERLSRLSLLDLSNVRRKLMEPEPEGRGWTEEQALEAEKWYRRYLAIIIKYPNATRHVPNAPIDLFWHQHILDTHAYGQDCEHVMGFFLHHYPYFGMNDDAKARDDSFDVTNELYIKEFGEDCKDMKSFGINRSAYCGNDCGGDNDSHHPSEPVAVGSKCGSGGSGTGCGQGCSRGVSTLRADFGSPKSSIC